MLKHNLMCIMKCIYTKYVLKLSLIPVYILYYIISIPVAKTALLKLAMLWFCVWQNTYLL